MGTNDTICVVRYAVHPAPLDLAGRDLISILARSRSEVAAALGVPLSTSGLQEVSVPVDKVTSMAGEIADEVQEWPEATEGPGFRSLSLHFRDGRLISVEWGFQLSRFLPQRKPWYRRLFG